MHSDLTVLVIDENAIRASIIEEGLREAVFRDLALLSCVGVQPIVVHGGGPEINQWLSRMQIQPQFRDGLRGTAQDGGVYG